MIDIPEEKVELLRELCRTIVYDRNYDELKSAAILASPSGEAQGESTALICHGRLLATRDLFDLIERVARPKNKETKTPNTSAGGKDPDLED